MLPLTRCEVRAGDRPPSTAVDGLEAGIRAQHVWLGCRP
jgi:hypothetical protein